MLIDRVTRAVLLACVPVILGGVSAWAQAEDPQAGVPVDAACINCALAGADIPSGTTLEGANFTGTDFSGATLAGLSVSGSSFGSTDLSGSDLSTSSFGALEGVPTSFDNANLSGANLSGVIVSDATFRFADLSCANLAGADMRGAHFDQGFVREAVSDGGCALDVTDAQFSCEAHRLAPWLVAAGAAPNPQCGTQIATAADATTLEWSCPALDASTLGQAVYVASTGTDSGSCGTSAGTACKTIQTGLNQCSGDGTTCGVLVAYGSYTPADTLSFPSNDISLIGGCLASGGSDGDRSQINTTAGARAMLFNATTGATVQNLNILGSQPGGTDGTPFVAISMTAQSAVHFENLTISGGQGAPGADGVASTAGVTGGNGSGQNGANTCNGWTGGDGGDGETTDYYDGKCHYSCKGNPSSDCEGNNGSGSLGGAGAVFTHITNACKVLSCPSGKYGATGGSGTHGTCGVNGTPTASKRGGVSGTTWVPSVSAPGTAGESGGPGGGGSGGSACSHTFSEYNGGHGGGGAAGGCGATEAGGGQQGGAWIGLNVSDQSVPTFANVIITGGLGGKGGDGGDAGAAAPGGSGGSPGSGSNDNGGGAGGPGGWSGSSGAGAGGNGGPSIGVLFAGMSESSIDGAQYINGQSGDVGKGGQPANNPSGAPCAPTDPALPGLPGDILAVVSIQ
ncbi:pentapeptide repeat-containing protein [uncultured Tateyamaria sp.]|uniref:pentapeptide repeat-containing protein n=1 Tax=uncultured Tateyamaria sp. TaxID=455651 RepID=UPI002616C2A9|nr:pentapeptide repeat-containing protein [uncultured Tateyamaria sp.]